MKILCWNVAGIRAKLKKGYLDFLVEADHDVVCFQETKAEEQQVSVPLKIWQKYIHIDTGRVHRVLHNEKDSVEQRFGLAQNLFV